MSTSVRKLVSSTNVVPLRSSSIASAVAVGSTLTDGWAAPVVDAALLPLFPLPEQPMTSSAPRIRAMIVVRGLSVSTLDALRYVGFPVDDHGEAGHHG
ncbi:hypothetical protein ACFQX7_09165 [Luedemannella flava]